MKFEAKVIPSGNATAVEVPEKVVAALGGGARPAVSILINGHGWRSRIARMRGLCLVGISAANRAGSGIALGEVVTVELKLDTAERTVAEPADLKRALDGDAAARAGFERLPFGLKRKHVASIKEAKAAATRVRRIERLVEMLRG